MTTVKPPKAVILILADFEIKVSWCTIGKQRINQIKDFGNDSPVLKITLQDGIVLCLVSSGNIFNFKYWSSHTEILTAKTYFVKLYAIQDTSCRCGVAPAFCVS